MIGAITQHDWLIILGVANLLLLLFIAFPRR